jgi:prepilin-type N-terminal cleavage/methylation domain-containing protein
MTKGMTKTEWHPGLSARLPSAAFTLLELVVVMAVIVVLAGLILTTSSYVHKEGARSRAEAEIAAIAAALESYKVDNGIYPSSNLLPIERNPVRYQAYSSLLYLALTGDTDKDGRPGPGTLYISFKPNQLAGAGSSTFIKDPFGNSYGYSTLGPTNGGYNPTFDLWSTAGDTDGIQAKWITNW